MKKGQKSQKKLQQTDILPSAPKAPILTFGQPKEPPKTKQKKGRKKSTDIYGLGLNTSELRKSQKEIQVVLAKKFSQISESAEYLVSEHEKRQTEIGVL